MVNFPYNLFKRIFVPFVAFILGVLFSNIFQILNNLEMVNTKYDDKPNLVIADDLFLVIVVLSAPENLDKRNAIRSTWLTYKDSLKWEYSKDVEGSLVFVPEYNKDDNHLRLESVLEQEKFLEKFKTIIELKSSKNYNNKKRMNIYHVFVMGLGGGLSIGVRSLLMKEHQKYNDLLLLHEIQDNYDNLTKKLLAAFEHLLGKYRFKYVLKCDDDTYVRLDYLVNELQIYDKQLLDKYSKLTENPVPNLYWGYFNGKAQIKSTGRWAEKKFTLCSRYLPYALGGGYVLSANIIEYFVNSSKLLNMYHSEDISVGTWTSPFRNLHRKHDVRFDTGHMPRLCKNYHIVLHKRTVADMFSIFNDDFCDIIQEDNTSIVRPKEYFYDWTKGSLQCCDRLVK